MLNLAPDGESTLLSMEKALEPTARLGQREASLCGRQRADQRGKSRRAVRYSDGNLCRTLLSGSSHRRLRHRPVLPGLYQDPLEEGKRTLGVCTFGIWDEDAYQLYMDVQTLLGLLEVVDLSSLRAAKIAEALSSLH